MKVMKFGGTSAGTPESMLLVKNIIEAEEESVIVVVSALGGVTDRLLLTADFALNANPGYQLVLEEIIFRHEEMIRKMVFYFGVILFYDTIHVLTVAFHY